MPIKNFLLVDSSVPDFQLFLDSANESTCVLLYSSSMTSNELTALIQQQATSAEKMGFVFRNGNTFVDEKPFFESDVLIFSLVQMLGVTTLDFLACNTLSQDAWTQFYSRLESTGITVGASSDQTGNLNYGGNWTMESTGKDIESEYFTQSIQYYQYLLDMAHQTFFIKNDGLLYTVGASMTGYHYTPVNLPYTNVKEISSGTYHTMILLENGDLYASGYNMNGQLGTGNNTEMNAFAKIESGVSRVACGELHTMILKGTTLYGAGSNTYGQLGLVDTTDHLSFTPIPNLTGVTDIACGLRHTMIRIGTVLYGTGYNSSGQLGLGDSTTRTSFVQITTGVYEVECGGYFTMILKGNTLWGTGNNDYGQLGLGGIQSDPDPRVFVEIDTGVSKVTCGVNHTMILKGTALYGAGQNSDGRLGLADLSEKRTFAPITTGVDQVICGYDYSILLKNGSLYGVGNNTYGQLGFQSSTTNASFNYTSTITHVNFIVKGLVNPLNGGPSIRSTVCFPAGSVVRTDQGLIEIQHLKPGVHTFLSQPMVALVDTYSMDEDLVCLEKDALRKNYPNKRTRISRRHKIYHQGKMRAAQRLVGKHDGVSLVHYEGEKLYNVLLHNYGSMNVNGMICETLHPLNPISNIFASMQLGRESSPRKTKRVFIKRYE